MKSSFVALAFALACERPAAEEEPPAAAVVVASSVTDPSGAPIDPLADPDAKAVVLVFVSTHCPISNRYAPRLSELATDFAARGVPTWLVYPDPDDDAKAITAHGEAFGLERPAVRDPEHELVARATATVTPEAAVFVQGERKWSGRIDDKYVAFSKAKAEPSTHDLRDAVDAVLRGAAPTPPAAAAVGCYIADLK